MDPHLHMEVMLVSGHGVQPTHKGAVIAIQAATEIGDAQTSIEAQKGWTQRVVIRLGDVLSKLDGMADMSQVFREFIVGCITLLLMDLLGHIGLSKLGCHLTRGRKTEGTLEMLN